MSVHALPSAGPLGALQDALALHPRSVVVIVETQDGRWLSPVVVPHAESRVYEGIGACLDAILMLRAMATEVVRDGDEE
jgi:hypothetical protein